MDLKGNNSDGSFTSYAEVVAEKALATAALEGITDTRDIVMMAISEVERDMY